MYNLNIFKWCFSDIWNILGSYYKCIQGFFIAIEIIIGSTS